MAQMADKMRKIKYSLPTAAGISVIAAAVCFSSSGIEKNASALVYFPDGSGSVSQLNDAIAADISSTAEQSGTAVSELEKALSAVPFGSGAEIVVSGLESPDNAPVILGSVLKNASDKTDFQVLSYCDMAENVQFPAISVSLSAGIAGGLAVYAAMSIADALKKKRYDNIADVSYEADIPKEPIKAEETQAPQPEAAKPPEPAPAPVPAPAKAVPIIGAAQRFYDEAVDLGMLMPSAPQGLEAAGYTRIARALSEQKSPLIIAVSSARTETDSIPYSVKVASYLACAFGSIGKRTAVIECNSKKPSLGRFFKKSGKGGLSDIAAGSCTIPEAVVLNARRGVDIYAEVKANPMPASVFSTPFYSEFLQFMSTVYDVMILTAPLARDDEWKYIARGCDGIIIASSDGRETDPISAAEILKSDITFTACCRAAEKSAEADENTQ